MTKTEGMDELVQRGWVITPQWNSNFFANGGNVIFQIRRQSRDAIEIREVFEDRKYGHLLPLRGKNVIDLNAGIGASAVWFVSVGAKQVLGVEASRDSAWMATRNVKSNKCRNVHIMNRQLVKTGPNPSIYRRQNGTIGDGMYKVSLEELLDWFEGEMVVIKGLSQEDFERLDDRHKVQVDPQSLYKEP